MIVHTSTFLKPQRSQKILPHYDFVRKSTHRVPESILYPRISRMNCQKLSLASCIQKQRHPSLPLKFFGFKKREGEFLILSLVIMMSHFTHKTSSENPALLGFSKEKKHRVLEAIWYPRISTVNCSKLSIKGCSRNPS